MTAFYNYQHIEILMSAILTQLFVYLITEFGDGLAGTKM